MKLLDKSDNYKRIDEDLKKLNLSTITLKHLRYLRSGCQLGIMDIVKYLEENHNYKRQKYGEKSIWKKL